MMKNRKFAWLFSWYFIFITIITTVIFISIGVKITNRFFSYYVDKMHEETQQMLVMKVAMHYMIFQTWDGYDAEKIGEAAELSGDYFTLKDMQGQVIYTSEEGVEKCCADDDYEYTQTELPVMVHGDQVALITAGYFRNHIPFLEAQIFRSSGIFLIFLSVICISVTGGLISILFFYRLSKPIQRIAAVAQQISTGYLQNRIDIKSNVSEMHEIADAINVLGQSLQNQEKFREQLITELSHELRTPLQILLNQIEAMLDGIYEADESRLESMHSEITRISELLNELEDRLIYENDVFDLNISKHNVSELVRKIAVGYEGGFAQKKLEFSYEVEPSVFAEVDATRFAQVLINLLSNALKYTHVGSVKLTLRKLQNSIELKVIDTGIGIDESIIRNIDIRRSVPPSRLADSRGVGLYIAKLIIDKHKWHLHINSTKDTGTQITILIDNCE